MLLSGVLGTCVNDELVVGIEALHPNLCTLRLWDVPITDASFKGSWPCLKELSVTPIGAFSRASAGIHLTTDAFTGSSFPSLSVLDTDFDVHSQRLTPLVTACPRLCCLKISGGENSIASSLSDLELPLLETLELSDLSWTPEAFDGLSAAKLPRLASLRLSDTHATGLTVQHIALHCPQLTELDLVNSAENDAAIVAIAEHCTGLQFLSLKFTGITDVALHACTRLSRLSYLDLLHVPDVTDAGLRAVAQGCPLLWSFGDGTEDGIEENAEEDDDE